MKHRIKKNILLIQTKKTLLYKTKKIKFSLLKLKKYIPYLN